MLAIEDLWPEAPAIMADFARRQEARLLARIRTGPDPEPPLVVQLYDGQRVTWPCGEPVRG